MTPGGEAGLGAQLGYLEGAPARWPLQDVSGGQVPRDPGHGARHLGVGARPAVTLLQVSVFKPGDQTEVTEWVAISSFDRLAIRSWCRFWRLSQK